MRSTRLPHQECWELLPWHANGTLAPDEAARVDEHLAGCAICREEVRACRTMATSLAGEPAAAGEAGLGESGVDHGLEADLEAALEAGFEAGAETGLARVMDRIAAAEAIPARRLAGFPAGRLRPVRWRTLAATPRPVRWLVGAQAAALVLAILAVPALRSADRTPGGFDAAPSETAAGAFRTLSDPAPAVPAAGAPRLRVVFADAAPAATVRDLLLAAGARVVDGPTPFGVYTVEPVAPGGDGDRSRWLMERLRADPAVLFAEPALGGVAREDGVVREEEPGAVPPPTAAAPARPEDRT